MIPSWKALLVGKKKSIGQVLNARIVFLLFIETKMSDNRAWLVNYVHLYN